MNRPAETLLEVAGLPEPLVPDELFVRDVEVRPEGKAEARKLELEIGFGKGRFLLAAAALWPDRDFLGVEHSRALARKVARRAERGGHSNLRLLAGDALALIGRVPAGALHRVHVYCPDPWPKRRHAKHRLFQPPFPDELARVLAPRGELLFSSDHDPYFREVCGRLAGDARFVRCLADAAFAELPQGGFDAIFEEAAVPVFKGVWELVEAGPRK